MELSQERLESYQKNLRCLQEVTEELMSHMKGHDWSFRQEITDKRGNFSQEKLRALVEELSSLWGARLENNTDIDPDTGKSVAEPYLQERRELYGLYLYLVMRCSLCQGGYARTQGGGRKERTDFAFVLEQAKRLSRSWCVTAGRDGSRKNELIYGYDEHFGFHLYSPIQHYLSSLEIDVRTLDGDFALTPSWKLVQTDSSSFTNEGNMKRFLIRHLSKLSPSCPAHGEEPEDLEELEETAELEESEEDSCDTLSVYDFDEDDDIGWSPLDALDPESRAAFEEAELERAAEQVERSWDLMMLVQHFEGLDEYCSACRRFQELFEGAKPQVLRDFYRELEEIVDLYLAAREIAPLTDTNKALNVYSRIYDGPCRQAKRYGRGLQWDSL